MITPFLTLVLVGYAVFVVALGAVWLQQALDEMRAKRSDRR